MLFFLIENSIIKTTVPKKIREIKKILLKAGFDYRQGKGSHQVWEHPNLSQKIVIARKDGDDAPLYLEK